eukprot:1156706-Pelagomonas_calceolata.AAC.10
MAQRLQHHPAPLQQCQRASAATGTMVRVSWQKACRCRAAKELAQAGLLVVGVNHCPWFNEDTADADIMRLSSLRQALQASASDSGTPWQPEDGYHVYYTRCKG